MAWQDKIFWLSALIGSGMFILQLLLGFLGFGDTDEAGESSLGDAIRIKWLSKQAVTGFLMLFGWTSLTCRHELSCSLPATLLFASAAGSTAVVIAGFIFRGARNLHSSGTVFSLDHAVGKEAFVYQRIPKGGIGKISISLNEHSHEIDAVSSDGEEIDSFVPVVILQTLDTQTLVVAIKGSL